MITLSKYVLANQQSFVKKTTDSATTFVKGALGKVQGKEALLKEEKLLTTIFKVAGEIFFALGAMMAVSGLIKSASIVGLPLGIISITLGVAFAAIGHSMYQVCENFEKQKAQAGDQNLSKGTVFEMLGMGKQTNRAINSLVQWAND